MTKDGIDDEMAEAMSNVVKELALELEHRYEGQSIVSAAPTVMKIERAVTALKSAGYTPPEVAVNVLARYRRNIN